MVSQSRSVSLMNYRDVEKFIHLEGRIKRVGFLRDGNEMTFVSERETKEYPLDKAFYTKVKR